MNILRFELKSMIRSTIIWGVSIVVVSALTMLIFPTYEAGAKDVTKILEAYPPELRAALNIDPKTLFSLNGFLGFIGTYIMLTSSIMGLYFGLSIFGREKRLKTSDFLVAKPVSRFSIFSQKLGAGLILLGIIDAAYYATLFFAYKTVNPSNSPLGSYMLIASTIVIVQLMMFCVGAFVANVLPKVKVPGSVATSIAFMLFIISMLYGIFQDEWMRYISPYKYFDTAYIIKHGALESGWLALSIGVSVVLLGASAIIYTKNDLHST